VSTADTNCSAAGLADEKAQSENIVESEVYSVMKASRTGRFTGLESAKPGARPGVLR